MNMFVRNSVPPEDVSISKLEEAAPHIDGQYATYASISTGVDDYSAPATLVGLDKSLGKRVTRHLLQEDAETTLHVAAMIFKDHQERVDLQTTLLVNIVKELSFNDEDVVDRRSKSEEVLRYCTLPADYRQHVLGKLAPKEVFNSPFIIPIEK